jgi:hypothetical protein
MVCNTERDSDTRLRYCEIITLGRAMHLEHFIINIVTWMATALLGNGPVNISRPNTCTQQ